ncbi:hypothetical protein [uncultured Pontibacter sp.]|nr:hypothetical protein [uncultured Pontibacter sp.]
MKQPRFYRYSPSFWGIAGKSAAMMPSTTLRGSDAMTPVMRKDDFG